MKQPINTKTLGMLGGGQLGRMFIQAAHKQGYKVHVFCQQADEPAALIADEVTLADFDDESALHDFASSIDAVSYEFENVPARTASILAEHTIVRPGAHILHICQDRIREKKFFHDNGIPIGEFAGIRQKEDVPTAFERIGFPAVLKTSNGGYDGKGQVVLKEGDSQSLHVAWDSLDNVPCILEAFVPFTAECSVIVARGVDGTSQVYGPITNVHTNHILDISSIPANVSEQAQQEAKEIAIRTADALDLVGVLCIELFQFEDCDGSQHYYANELAPRPHNSGHLTIEAFKFSQFDQQVLTLTGQSPAPIVAISPAAMLNILGEQWASSKTTSFDSSPGKQFFHDYAKSESRPGRKMGHITLLANSNTEAIAQAQALKQQLSSKD